MPRKKKPARKPAPPLKFSWKIPKHSQADPNDPEAWEVVEELPPAMKAALGKRLSEQLIPLMAEFLRKVGLHVDDFPEGMADQFMRSYFGHMAGLEEDQKIVRQTVAAAWLHKIERMEKKAAEEGQQLAPALQQRLDTLKQQLAEGRFPEGPDGDSDHDPR